MKTLIKNVKIITENDTLINQALVIDGQTIDSIVDPPKVIESDYEVVNGNGHILVPGFIDIHNHGNSGFDMMDASYEAIEEMGKYHAKNGVTSFLGATMTNPKDRIESALKNAKEYIQRNYRDNKSADFLGIYLEGPFFSVEKKGAQPEKDIRDINVDEMNDFINVSGQVIKVIALAPELDKSSEVITDLRHKNIKVALGHSMGTYSESVQAIDAGANIATHLYNGMRSFTHREPGIIGATLTDDRIYAELIVDLIHLHKAAISLAIKAKGYDKIILVSDAMRATGLADGEYDLGGQIVVCKQGKANLKDGTIAGSTLNLNQAVKNLVKELKIDLRYAINMASINPARAIGVDDYLGSIEVGKRADFVLLNHHLDVEDVWIKGVQI